jgi:hypothetical protein
MKVKAATNLDLCPKVESSSTPAGKTTAKVSAAKPTAKPRASTAQSTKSTPQATKSAQDYGFSGIDGDIENDTIAIALAARLTTNDPSGATLEAEAKKKNLPIYKGPRLTMKVTTLVIDFTTSNATKSNSKVVTPLKPQN